MEKQFTSRDMVKIGCHDCRGCFSCCQGMGDTVVLNPYDIYELTKNLGKTFEQLLEREIALHTEEGMILPHIRMEAAAEKCVFLDEQGRCSIHPFRPGLCRLFPLGRSYDYPDENRIEEGEAIGFHYFILEEGCPQKEKTKIKIEKWLGVPRLAMHEAFILSWHNFCKKFQKKAGELIRDPEQEEYIRQMNLFVLQMFYGKAYDAEQDFYKQIEERLAQADNII